MEGGFISTVTILPEKEKTEDLVMSSCKQQNAIHTANTKKAIPIHITHHPPNYHLRYPWNPDFTHDLKLLPSHARHWNPDRKCWLVNELYINAVADFILAHYGIDLTPERNDPIQPTIEQLAPAREVYYLDREISTISSGTAFIRPDSISATL